MHRKRLFLTCFCMNALFLFGQTSEVINSFVNNEVLKSGSFSFKAIDCETGEARYAHRSDKEIKPASITKLLTTATALRLLTPTFRYETTLAHSGTVRDSVLAGDLYIVGSGDPSLGTAHIKQAPFSDQWVKAVRAAGIKQIEGRVIADDSAFDNQGVSLFWSGDDYGAYYAAGSYGLNAFDNAYTLYLRSGGAHLRPWVVGTKPEGLDIRFANHLVAAPVKEDSIHIFGFPYCQKREIYGIVPLHSKRISCRGDIPDPPLFLAQHLTKELQKGGIAVQKPASCYRLLREAKAWKKQTLTTIHTHLSPPLAEIVRTTNYRSHNLFADALLKTIGERSKESFPPGISSYGKGVETLRRYWAKQGLDVSRLFLYDGSGLSGKTAMTADLLCKVLQAMTADKTFRASLPTAGRSGTVTYFMDGTHLAGKAWLKSGSISRVRNYAGYVDWKGKTYIVALFVNNYTCPTKEMIAKIEQLLLQLFP